MTPELPGFDRVVVNGVRWRVTPECRDRLFAPSAAGEGNGHGLPAGLPLDAWLHDGRARVIKHGPHRTVYRVHLGGLDFFLKHNRVHNTRALLRQFVRPSKARLECDKALAAARRGVATITPLAVGETDSPWPGDSYLLTR